MAKNFEIKMNAKGLKDVEKQITRDLKKEMQAFFDKFARSHKGQPVEQVKRALAQAWKRELGGSITDPELTDYANVISEGRKITVK